MRLIWKVLRQNLSVGQLIGFIIANIIGLTIIVLGVQLYHDIQPILSNKAGFMRPDFMVLTKPVSTLDAISGTKPAFEPKEIEELRQQPFVEQLGTFTAAQYRIYGQLVVKSYGIDVGSDLFFEAVPDDFIDVESEEWTFTPGDTKVPIIVPRTYLNLYNFGYAPTSDFPAISESMVNKVVLNLTLWSNGRSAQLKGRIIGFSSRINTILVPQTFIEWSNAQFAPYRHQGDVSRLILRVSNPTDERIATYCKEHELNIEGDNLNASKASWLMRILVAVVLIIGLVICLLAAYVLMLSIFLLMQRNQEAIRNLKAIGYTSHYLARPYQLLVFLTNLISVAFAMIILTSARHTYLAYLIGLAPDLRPASLAVAWLVAILFAIVLSAFSARVIYRSIR